MAITQDIITKLEEFITTTVKKINTVVNIHNIDPSAHEDKQLKDNLVTSWGKNPSDTKYPSEKLVKKTIDNIMANGEESFDPTELEERISALEEAWSRFYEDMAR